MIIEGRNARIELNGTPMRVSSATLTTHAELPPADDGSALFYHPVQTTAELSGSAVFDMFRLPDFIPCTKVRLMFGGVVIEQTIAASGFRPLIPKEHANPVYKKIARYLRKCGYQNYEYWMAFR